MLVYTFQFLSGMRLYSYKRPGIYRGYSFNSFLGCDLRYISSLYTACFSKLSIPFWDATLPRNSKAGKGIQLSIPFWDATKI